jgi:hypothetical protein
LSAIDDWNPDFLVCTDDSAVKVLHTIHAGAIGATGSGAKRLVDLIERSLGAPHSFEFSEKKSALVQLAQSLGVRCPATTILSRREPARDLQFANFPTVVKGDGSWGGKSVRLVDKLADARRAVAEFTLRPSLPGRVRAMLARTLSESMIGKLSSDQQCVCLQEYISGNPANRAVLCWEGKVVDGVSVRVHDSVYAFGPASLVEIVDIPEMTEAANIIARSLHLSGFIGFDFVIDSEKRAWFLEMNPRVTPTSYLTASGAPDLSRALYSMISGIDHAPQRANLTGDILALFPQEIQRSGKSDHIASKYDDVPWAEPKLVLALMQMAFKSQRGVRRRNELNALSALLDRERRVDPHLSSLKQQP